MTESLMLLAASQETAIMFALAASTIGLAVFILAALPQLGLQAASLGMMAAEILQAAILIF